MNGEQERVLVVDDEEAVRNLLQRILGEADYQVTTAANGKEALYKVLLGEVEVVLLDIKMPGMEVLSKLSADSPDTCVIMVTSIVDTETAVEAMKTGAYDYIIKPFDRDDVLQKVQEAIERWKRRLKEKQRYLKLQESIAVEPPKAAGDYEEKASKELEPILEGTPDMIIECIMNFVKTLNSQGYAYKSTPRIGGAPDYAKWDKTYSARCIIAETREGIEKQLGSIRLQLLPNDHTLFKIPEPEHWDSPFGQFISFLLGEFKRLGFVYFKEEKPPIGFRLPHKEKNI